MDRFRTVPLWYKTPYPLLEAFRTTVVWNAIHHTMRIPYRTTVVRNAIHLTMSGSVPYHGQMPPNEKAESSHFDELDSAVVRYGMPQ